VNPETGEVRNLVSSGLADFFTSQGYAIAVADMRGTGASTGWLLDFMPEIWSDGARVVEWLAEQPWSDGNVGMMGGSYVGWSQTATASQKPPALKAIAPSVIPLEGYTGEIYPGGIFLQRFIDTWAGFMFPAQRNHFDPDGGTYPTLPAVDEDGDGELIDEIPLDVDGSGSFLDEPYPPVYADGAEREHIYYRATKEHEENYDYASSTRDMFFIDRALNLGYDAYDIGPNAHIGAIMETDLPIYHFGGWFDGFTRGTFELYATMLGSVPQKLAMLPAYHSLTSGPFWQHFGHDDEAVGELYLNEHLRFFDRYLKGIDNGIEREPPISIYVMNGEGWRFENEWPLARERRRRLFFGEGGLLAEAREGDGRDEYVADFGHDSSYGGNRGNRWTGIAGVPPDEVPWRTDKASQTLVYETTPLTEAMEVTGHPLVNLVVSSSASHGDFFVYLEDVDTEGRSILVSEAQLRAGFAALVDNDEIVFSGEQGIDVEPELPWHGYEEGQYVDGMLAGSLAVEMVFDFLPTSWVFREGHRVRVSIAASDHPTFRLHPRLSPSNDPAAADNIVPTITVHRGEGRESWVDLPVIPLTPAPGDP
jgi:putative CocE/NonD family hydrolase